MGMLFKRHHSSMIFSGLRILFLARMSSDRAPEPSTTPIIMSRKPRICMKLICSFRNKAAPISEKNGFRFMKMAVFDGPI